MKSDITLIISDTHFGNPESNAEAVTSCIESTYFDKIILNGDIVDITYMFKHGTSVLKQHWPYIKRIHKALKGKKVYYMIGNHDRYNWLLFPFGWLIGTKIRQRIRVNNYIVEHGDGIKLWLQIRKLFNKNIIIYTDPGETGEEDYHNNCMELAKIKGHPFIVGHSHVPRIERHLLYDGGDWVKNNTYLIMKHGCCVKLRYF